MPTLRRILSIFALTATALAQQPDLTLKGTINGSQNNTYLGVPFEVPAGIERLTVAFRYTG
ncbi:MAG TPA: hypothetical protein VJ453_03230, partial [Terriglobales bacterium]|nr:hypothetical protein [Terriglobales bacterium]